MLRLLALLSIAALVAGFLLALTGAGLIAGILLILFGLALGSVLGAIAAARKVRDTVAEWRSLISGGGPESVRIVGIEPPRGVLFNRDATVTLEVRGQDGTAKQIQREIPIPLPQALMWRLAGRVPTPIGRLTDARELDLALYRKRSA